MNGSEIRQNTVVDGFQGRSPGPPDDTSREKIIKFLYKSRMINKKS